MRFYIYKIKDDYPGNWDEAIYNRQCEIVTVIEAENWEEADKIAFELGYSDIDKYSITTINDF